MRSSNNAGLKRARRAVMAAACCAATVAGAAALWNAGPAAASALKVEASEFVVSVSDGEGNQRSIESDIVPYLPDRACFGWRLRVTDAPRLVRYREILKLPHAPAFWSGEDDEYSPHVFSADRTTATTEEFAAPDADGWLSSSWCIVDGDPVGRHSIDVYLQDALVRHFDFEVKKVGSSQSN